MHPTDDPSWASYFAAILEFHAAPSFTVDLAKAIDPATHAALVALPVAVPFAILTASNPRGQLVTPAENSARVRELETCLAGEHIGFVQVDGCSPDRAHREVGVAVHLPLEAAKALARRFDQSAIYWYDGWRVWLIPVLVDGGPRALPIA